MHGIIYLATNSMNGKVYIGQTIQTIGQRKREHLSHARRMLFNSTFHAAIRKYGFEKFSWEIIDRAESHEELDRKEKALIAEYQSTNPKKGYNLSAGGPGVPGIPKSEAQKALLRAASKKWAAEHPKEKLPKKEKVYSTPEEKSRKLREAAAKRKQDPEYGKKISENMKRLWADPEYAKQQMEVLKKGLEKRYDYSPIIPNHDKCDWFDSEYLFKFFLNTDYEYGHYHLICLLDGSLFWCVAEAARACGKNAYWIRKKITIGSEWQWFDPRNPQHRRMVIKAHTEHTIENIRLIGEKIAMRLAA